MRKSITKITGFTLVELLTVLAVITLLAGLMMPSLQMARRVAKETSQRAQFASMAAALTAFRNDYGQYPPSEETTRPVNGWKYCGAQQLCEAFLGFDLLGFHPDSEWQPDGRNKDGSEYIYRQDDPVQMDRRRGRYLDLSKVNAFRVGGTDGLYGDVATPLGPPTFLLCDVFGRTRITLLDGNTVRAGAPILYYRANTFSRSLTVDGEPYLQIYNYFDNMAVIYTQDMADDGVLDGHPLGDENFFYGDPPDIPFGYVQDPRVPNPWPYRPESYLLISAGADGIYGTADDIRNFGN
jgi:prepilin-type N-terminal cleavage/methylation domain-containing protein